MEFVVLTQIRPLGESDGIRFQNFFQLIYRGVVHRIQSNIQHHRFQCQPRPFQIKHSVNIELRHFQSAAWRVFQRALGNQTAHGFSDRGYRRAQLIRQRAKIQHSTRAEFTAGEGIVQGFVYLFAQLGLIDLCDAEFAHSIGLSDAKIARVV